MTDLMYLLENLGLVENGESNPQVADSKKRRRQRKKKSKVATEVMQLSGNTDLVESTESTSQIANGKTRRRRSHQKRKFILCIDAQVSSTHYLVTLPPFPSQ